MLQFVDKAVVAGLSKVRGIQLIGEEKKVHYTLGNFRNY